MLFENDFVSFLKAVYGREEMKGSLLKQSFGGGPGGSLQLRLYGVVFSHTIGKLTHPQTKLGLSINKNRSIPRLCTIKYEPKLTKLQQVSFDFTITTHSQVQLSKR